ncbi:TRI14-like protein [Cordyceps fumosorosea ARSEF 2679]|uniref:TRI14-like protein n=1 Tax=Cordyceps fumosorosea (strain ARSEF 2679) TaxID=1081104 RepID=A0A167RMP1_CORFA|nr:TRI14-like protein [Cordyceps fumosorosea ARSEF 2679]OAA58746.1 TRI14-like protein [Cordyceps fumosorosea ARSEF 2679]
MSSVLFNASVAVYDAAKNEVTNTISFPGLSGDPTLHSTGVRVDPLGHLFVVINAGAAFDTLGKDLSGNNFLVKYDLKTNQTIFTANLTAVSNGAYGGFQDVQHTKKGDSFVLGTYGRSSILRVSADGSKVIPWFVGPPLGSSDGFSGLALRGHNLIVANQADGQLYRFDTRREEGVPVRIPLGSGNETIGQDLDAVYMPPRYDGRILLVSRYNLGTVVLRSRDASWRVAEKLGTIPNPYREQGALSVATVEMGARLYSVNLFSSDAKVQGSNAGNRTDSPLQDISDEVEKYSTL